MHSAYNIRKRKHELEKADLNLRRQTDAEAVVSPHQISVVAVSLHRMSTVTVMMRIVHEWGLGWGSARVIAVAHAAADSAGPALPACMDHPDLYPALVSAAAASRLSTGQLPHTWYSIPGRGARLYPEISCCSCCHDCGLWLVLSSGSAATRASSRALHTSSSIALHSTTTTAALRCAGNNSTLLRQLCSLFIQLPSRQRAVDDDAVTAR